MNTKHIRKGGKKSKMMLLVIGATAAALTQGARLTQYGATNRGVKLSQEDITVQPAPPTTIEPQVEKCEDSPKRPRECEVEEKKCDTPKRPNSPCKDPVIVPRPKIEEK